jgi:hypothetical protein
MTARLAHLAGGSLGSRVGIEGSAVLLAPVARPQLAQPVADRLEDAGVVELVEPFADPEPLLGLARAETEDVGEQEDLPLAVCDNSNRLEQVAGGLEQLRSLGGISGAVRYQARLRRCIEGDRRPAAALAQLLEPAVVYAPAQCALAVSRAGPSRSPLSNLTQAS